MSKNKQYHPEMMNPPNICDSRQTTARSDDKAHRMKENHTRINHTSDGIGFKDTNKPKYKAFYHRLYKCLCYLELENRKLLEAVQNKTRVTGEVRQLDEFLDDFAFEVASKKDDYERGLIGQATTEGQQAFMAKRWKMRYHNLLELGLEFERILKEIKLSQSGDRINKTYANDATGSGGGGGGNSSSGSTSNLLNKQNMEFFNEALNLPWESDLTDKLKSNQSVRDIVYDWGDREQGRSRSCYEYGDFTIPISSVFIQDLLANHKLCAEEIKSQNEIKCRLFHVLKKTKEQRNQLKRCVIDQEAQIQILSKAVQETELLLVKNSKLKSNVDDLEQNASSNGDNEILDLRNGKEDGKRIQQTTLPFKTNDSEQTESDHSKDLIRERELDEQKEIEDLIQQCQALEYRKRELEGVLAEEEQQRKILSKKLQDLVGTIHVSCRIKPHPDNYLQIVSDDKLLLPKTLERLKNCAKSDTDNSQMRCFIFEKVLGPDTSHYEIFKKLGQPLGSCLDGQNLCVMTYGPKKSGKFFTMFGAVAGQKPNDSSSNTSGGIAQDTVHLLLSMARQRTTWHYDIYLKALSITDEGIRDLLKDNKSSFLRTVKTLAPDDEDGLPPTKQVELKVGSDFDSVVHYIHDTELKRFTQPHHMIMKITIEGTHRAIKENTRSVLILAKLASWDKKNNQDDSEILTSQVTPNSESNSFSESMALQQTATGKNLYGVNQSLSALSRVFSALRKRKIPNYNESALTRILRPALTGQSKCFLIVTINSDPNEFTSTLASLQFAQNVMQAPTRLLGDSKSRLCSPNHRESPTAQA